MDGNDMFSLALELASWFAFGACVVVAVIAVIVHVTSGTWRSTNGVVDDDGAAIRWFIDGGEHSGHAELSREQRDWLNGRTEVEIFYRDGRPGTFRFEHPHSHVRVLWYTALGLLVLGVAASVAQLFVMAP
ncbi:hypothetical protein [Paramicrobacterium agarici]|uniref:DUF3592 domain-containing protein n=1 Tax=Paramicrobacterium agarici TaxID=630514 RepID=A0A2A9E123_9MICO|nr:hypothetical protein [Microbacterium agarici]PFG32075.1 hypothetical protein ATJ78_3059 [Microbacterium agarici]